MTMRRLSLMLVLVAALAACSSGSNNVASSTTTPAAASSRTSVAETYADLMETIGKAAQPGNMDEASLSKAMAVGIAGKAKDVATVAKWVSTNCKL